MPLFFVEAPEGVRPEAKQRMMEAITAAIDEVYRIPDTRVWLREYPADNAAQDGRTQAEPIRPVGFLEGPELFSLDAKRKLFSKLHTAIDEAYQDIANTRETLILLNHYPLDDAGVGGRSQADNPEIVEAIRQMNG